MNCSPALKSLRALVALVVTLLQVISALHFSLVQHTYSAALGGVVHVHPASLTRSEAARPDAQSREPRAPSVTGSTLSCLTDRCVAANAPQSVAPHFEA